MRNLYLRAVMLFVAFGFITLSGALAYPLATPYAGTGTKQTLTVTGAIRQQQNYDPNLNFAGSTSAPGVALGDTMTLTLSWDSDQVYYPTAQIPNAKRLGWTAVALADGNSFNSVTLSVGSLTYTLADQYCYDPTNLPTCGQQFAYGPTILFKDGQFAGLDSCLGIDTGFQTWACGLALDNLGTPFAVATDGPFRDWNRTANPVIRSRTDNVYFFDTNFSLVYTGWYDITPVTNVPAPGSLALMVAACGLLAAAARRRTRG